MTAQFDLFAQPILDHEPNCDRSLLESDHPSLAPFWQWWQKFEDGHVPTSHEVWKYIALLEQRIHDCVILARSSYRVPVAPRSRDLADWYIVQAEQLLKFWDDLAQDSERKRPEVSIR